MAGRSSYQTPLSSHEQVIVDLVRLGSDGDAASVRQLGRRLLQQAAKETDREAFREALGTVLVASGDRTTRSVAPVDVDDDQDLVTLFDGPASATPVLNEAVQTQIDRLIAERRAAPQLLEAGLEPPRSLLLQGPPGVGKTLTASWIAERLQLPLVTIELAAVMSSYLGQTGTNLRRVLDHARSFPCVLFLDEFDALAKRRDDDSDVGELKRLVNVLLLEIDRWPSQGLLIAATNHPQLLDPAAERRFDMRVQLDAPDQPARQALLHAASGRYGLELPEAMVPAYALAFRGDTGAEIDRVMAAAAREAVLSGEPGAQSFAARVLERLRASDDEDELAAFCAIATTELRLPQRAVAKMLGVSHPTVGKWAKRWDEMNGRSA